MVRRPVSAEGGLGIRSQGTFSVRFESGSFTCRDRKPFRWYNRARATGVFSPEGEDSVLGGRRAGPSVCSTVFRGRCEVQVSGRREPPAWRADGRNCYLADDGTMMTVRSPRSGNSCGARRRFPHRFAVFIFASVRCTNVTKDWKSDSWSTGDPGRPTWAVDRPVNWTSAIQNRETWSMPYNHVAIAFVIAAILCVPSLKPKRSGAPRCAQSPRGRGGR